MLLNLLAGLPVMLLCLLLQAVFVTICLRHYVRFRHAQPGRESQLLNILLLSMVMLLMLLGNFVQIAIWAALFMLLGEFDDFATALYHSGSTSPRWATAISSCPHHGVCSAHWRQPTAS